MTTTSQTAMPLPGLPNLFHAIASSILAGKSQLRQAKPRILVIDNERAICELLLLYLGEMNFEVATARSAHEARALLQRGQFDLVILEWMLDGVQALDLLHLSKTYHPEVPVILFTAEDVDDASLAGRLARKADAVVPKLGPLDALSKTIFRILDQRQGQPLKAA